MKNMFRAIKGLALLAVLVLAGLSARAQYDEYGLPTIIALPPTAISNVASINVTNQPIDLRGMDGLATILVVFTNNASSTNAPTQSATLAVDVLQGNSVSNGILVSSSILTNYALSTLTSVSQTNFQTGLATNPANLATNFVMVPGSLSNAVPSVQGFAGQFLVPAPFTNSGALCTNSAGSIIAAGVNLGDCQRYFQVIYRATGSNCAWSCGGAIIGRRRGRL